MDRPFNARAAKARAGSQSDEPSARVPFRERGRRGVAGAGGGSSAKSTSAKQTDVQLLFGSAWEDERVKEPRRGAVQRPALGAKRRTNLETRTLNGQRSRAIPYHGRYPMSGRWLSEDYPMLRNAAWAVRNARVGNEFNPLALRLVVAEAEMLMSRGEELYSVIEAFAELLCKP